MTKLFWRVFLLFWLTLLLTISLVRLTFIWQNDEDWRPGMRPPPPGVLQKPMTRSEPPLHRHPIFHLTLLLISSAIFSLLLARYIVSPIRQLKQALAELAGHRWQTRLDQRLISRRDEFGSLSRNFNHMATQASNAIASQQRLLHDVSHELRSPLARMQILTGLAAQSPADAMLAISRIEQETEKLNELVDEILTFSRLDSGGAAPQLTQVDLADLLKVLVDDAQLEAQALHKTIFLHLAEVPLITADPDLLCRAIENVLRNAIKFSPAYSEITLRLCQKHHSVKLEIADQGPGVPEALQDKLFTPFFRANSSFSGVGLGLSIAKRAIDSCGGSINAYNLWQQQRISGFVVCIKFPISSSAIQLE